MAANKTKLGISDLRALGEKLGIPNASSMSLADLFKLVLPYLIQILSSFLSPSPTVQGVACCEDGCCDHVKCLESILDAQSKALLLTLEMHDKCCEDNCKE